MHQKERLFVLPRSVDTIVFYLNTFLTVATCYKCLQCDDVPLPNLCDKVGECGTHELCAVEQYNTSAGSFRYRQICMDKQKCGDFSAGYNALTCTECCHGDLCNAGGCGEKGFDPALGPLCYTCHLQIGTRSCNKIQQCGRDKDCSIHPVTRLGASNNLFETKCTERNICVTSNRIGSSAIVGRKRSTCSICCNSTLCNDYDPRLCVPTTITKSITTVLATHEVCEDAPNVPCHERACNGSPKEYMEKNCRKTCKFCAVKTTPVATSTTTAISTASPSTVTSTSLRTSTMSISRSGMTGHTHDPFCLDNAVGCDQYVHFCVLDEYKTWTKTNCRRTCGYC